MNSTRRQFVAVTLAAMPALSSASAAPRVQKPNSGNDDPVWAQVQEELTRLQNEVKSGKPTPQTIRAFESTLRFHAAHATSKGHQQRLAQAIRNQIRAKGRAGFLADALDLHRQHDRQSHGRLDSQHRVLPLRAEPTIDELGSVSDRLVRGNYIAMLRESADANSSLRDKLAIDLPPGLRLVARRAVADGYCSDYSQAVNGIRWLKDLICVLAAFDPPLFLAECLALQTEVWLMEMFEWIFCMAI